MRAKKQLRGAIASGALAGNVHSRSARGWQPAAAAWWVAVAIAAMAAPAQAQTPQAVAFDIPAQPLVGALRLFSQQAKQQVLFDQATVAGRSAPAVRGSLTPRQALDRLLAGTGIAIIQSQPDAFTLRLAPPDTAQTPITTLSTVTVTAQADANGTTEGTGSYTTDLMRTATKLDLSIRETPQSITVLTRQRIEDQQLRNLDDVVQSTPGLTYQKIGPERQAFYARGFEVDNVMYDGLPTSNAAYLTAPASLAMYDRVEIVRGATGLMQGAGNPSASMNLVRKRPTRESQISLTANAGSWNAYGGDLDISGPVNEAATLRSRVVASYHKEDSFQRNVGHEYKLLYGVAEADIANRTTLTLGASYQKDHAKGSYGALIAAPDGSDLHLPRSTSFTNDWEYNDKETAALFADLEHRFDNGWKARLAATTSRSKLNFFGSYFETWGSWTPASITQAAGKWDYDYEQTSFDAYATGPVMLLGRKHELVVGASRRKADRYTYGTQGQSVSTINVYDWRSAPAPDMSGGPFWTFGGLAEQTGTYATFRANVSDRLKLIVGGRLDWYDGDSYKVSRNLTKYAGAIYDLDAQHSAYASYTDIFQPQDYNDINGRTLDPVTGKNYELGVKGEYFGGALNASAALFLIDQENRAKSLSDQSNCPTYPATSCYEAVGLVRSKGVDLEIQGALTPNWQFAAGYTYTDARYKRDATASNVGKNFNTNLPRNSFKLSTTYRLPGAWQQWRVGGGLQVQSDMYQQGSAYRIQQGGYAVANLMVGYQATQQLDLQFNVNNLFDRRYYQSITGLDSIVYGAPRQFLLTARYRF